MTCRYPEPLPARSFSTCAECPLSYPSPTSVFYSAVAVTGGIASIEITNAGASSYEAHFCISNNTDEAIFDWQGRLSLTSGQVTAFWRGTGTVNGTDVTLISDQTDKYLKPGETWYIGFWTGIENLRIGFPLRASVGEGDFDSLGAGARIETRWVLPYITLPPTIAGEVTRYTELDLDDWGVYARLAIQTGAKRVIRNRGYPLDASAPCM